MNTGQATQWWPVAVYFACALVLVAGMLLLSFVLGQRHKRREGEEPYESGIVEYGPAKVRLSVKYYLVAMFFVVFDLEVVFVVAWAVAARELGWTGYVAMGLFVGLLLLALAYLWRLGALDWGTTALKKRKGI
jgi:NADH-quinone oxidoreductase subunit A